MNICSPFNAPSGAPRPLPPKALQTKKPEDDPQQAVSSPLSSRKNFPTDVLLCIGAHIKDPETIKAWVLACVFFDKKSSSSIKIFASFQKHILDPLKRDTFTQKDEIGKLALTPTYSARLNAFGF